MAQYIDKSAVVAEIERGINEIDEIGTYLSPKGTLINLLCHLDTLEVEEVDLEKEIDVYSNALPCRRDDIEIIAKHFFELGLKANKVE